ncbi:MAG TPA: undecaprenyl-diphosphatase [Halieaceae bacterium]|jgi:undecaprenyl-diphosphatase|uniref:undecaprenyl-diphosphate phosphatase n=1 Tax=Haliea TaxID=475794 RepID=UPI000C3B877A|nr:undecaprenyl-diphosphate phosphatase [Haliea sp.]HBQ40314.1 undecaprenyl-diphosphatase [Halieaceae bacterium]MAD63425.1 undecaprenyl-diphosphatase [Haliea sp.]MAY93507.1 undecaprenyl-diphosphatase [Haliea sp.]MBK41266.1 undecaprenyl-diphosphatase [Haliea sp.]MBP71823.1 undecaprenyl-diphosphatase [Haliea sp.]|tara:strand:+ start:135 stop:935 length:801 start_codon:yes stop_codon:yes gene_type:complete
MDILQAMFLAFLQGVTEFLPISSSAHLVIPSLVLGWQDEGLTFDVAVHVGTLLAVVTYYRRDLLAMTESCLGLLRGRGTNADTQLVFYLAVATVPVCVVGFLADDFIESQLRSLPVIATTTLLFGLLLGLADRHARLASSFVTLTLGIALIIGVAQALAPVPGVSRSGVTLTAGLLLGLNRATAARFAFLLSIPVIAGAGLLKGMQLAQEGAAVEWGLMAAAALLAAVTAYACIGLFLRLLERVGLMPFVYYRIVLAAVLYTLWLR